MRPESLPAGGRSGSQRKLPMTRPSQLPSATTPAPVAAPSPAPATLPIQSRLQDGRPDRASDANSSETARANGQDRPVSATPAVTPVGSAVAVATPVPISAASRSSGESDPSAIGEPLLTDARGSDAPARQDQGASRPMAEQARPVIAQIVEQLRLSNGANGTVDVTLSPEELGRLTLSLSAQDGALAVTVAADRPETLDLIRRHLDLLQQEARDAGFTGLSFDFGNPKGGDSPPRQPAQFGTGGDVPSVALPQQTHAPRPIQNLTGPTGGLDIRL